MVGFFGYFGLPLLLPVASRALTTFRDSSSATSPKTTCLPSSQLVTRVVIKNWDPLLRRVSMNLKRSGKRAYVLGPALAMERSPGLVCLRVKFSSANFSP
jgi:hypothetical protein